MYRVNPSLSASFILILMDLNPRTGFTRISALATQTVRPCTAPDRGNSGKAQGEAEYDKGPADLCPAERAHRIFVRPGGNKG